MADTENKTDPNPNPAPVASPAAPAAPATPAAPVATPATPAAPVAPLPPAPMATPVVNATPAEVHAAPGRTNLAPLWAVIAVAAVLALAGVIVGLKACDTADGARKAAKTASNDVSGVKTNVDRMTRKLCGSDGKGCDEVPDMSPPAATPPTPAAQPAATPPGPAARPVTPSMRPNPTRRYEPGLVRRMNSLEERMQKAETRLDGHDVDLRKINEALQAGGAMGAK